MHNGRRKGKKEIFIDTEDFERVSEFNGEWRLFTDAGTGKENDYVIQVSEGGGKYTTLHLFLKDVPNDKQKYTRRANGNKLDLRKENLMILNKGEGNMSETKRKAQEIAQQLPTISMKERVEKTL
ncbi:hypothetical protein F3K44_31330 [Bacillus megaterium]|nr:hypothetical protein [Priestia megaterium]